MKLETLTQFKFSKRYSRVMARSASNSETVFDVVQPIVIDVQTKRDKALRLYTKQFDGATISNFRVSRDEIQKAYKQIHTELLRSLYTATDNIRIVHKAEIQTMTPSSIKPSTGVTIQKRWFPIERIGIYVPGGKATYPSSVLMNTIPAIIAGCTEIIMVTPPRPDGSIDPTVLVAADIAGVSEIYKVGGAQAIAALAYGTETVPKVYKIVGPGNAYVTSAKQLVANSGLVSIDSPAGPSEVLIIADKSANPKFVTADLVCDAEHGDDSTTIFITTSAKLGQTVIQEIKNLIPQFTTKSHIQKSIDRYGAFLLVNSLKQAIEFANGYAAEHVEIMTKNAQTVAKQIQNAGSVFIGDYTCKSAGDYATGANHVLPTSMSAKMYSGLSTYDFLKQVSYQTCTKRGLTAIRKSIEYLAEAEGLPAHKYSCSVRFRNENI